jgi:hypothetical protein
MKHEFEAEWRPVGGIDPRDLVEARLQLHWAVQPVMAFADCALDRLPDDSQSNFGWRHDLGALMGRPRPDGLSAGLRISDMTLLVFDRDGAQAETVALEGRTIDWAVSWLEELVASRTGGPPDRPIRIRDYEMPAHPVARGAAFTIQNERALRELARWFANGDLALEKMASSDDGWGEVRCWPHHFDLGVLFSLEPTGDASAGRSIGAGLSPGDHWYTEPYFYVNPYGWEEFPDDRPTLESGGHWHAEGWFGAVLPASRVFDVPEASQESAVSSFLHSAVAGARHLLTV